MVVHRAEILKWGIQSRCDCKNWIDPEEGKCFILVSFLRNIPSATDDQRASKSKFSAIESNSQLVHQILVPILLKRSRKAYLYAYFPFLPRNHFLDVLAHEMLLSGTLQIIQPKSSKSTNLRHSLASRRFEWSSTLDVVSKVNTNYRKKSYTQYLSKF